MILCGEYIFGFWGGDVQFLFEVVCNVVDFEFEFVECDVDGVL